MKLIDDEIKSEICEYLCRFGRLSISDLAILVSKTKNDNAEKINNMIQQLKRDRIVVEDENNDLFAMHGAKTDDFSTLYLPYYMVHKAIITLAAIKDDLLSVKDIYCTHRANKVITFTGNDNGNEYFYELIYAPSGKESLVSQQISDYDYFLKNGAVADIENKEKNFSQLMKSTRRYVIIDNQESINKLSIHNIYGLVIVVNDKPYFKILKKGN